MATNQTADRTQAQGRIVVLITGANRGIGLATCAALAPSAAYHILLCARSLSQGQAAANTFLSDPSTKAIITAVELDVISDVSVSTAVKHIESKLGHVDVLLNNAGINSSSPSLLEATRANFAANVEGTVRVTEAFLQLLRASPNAPPNLTPDAQFQAGRRLILVGSSTGSLTHASNPASQYYGPPSKATPTQPEDTSVVRRFSSYRATKAAVNMLMVEYHKKLAGEGFKVCVADPGLVVTDLVDAEMARKRGAPEASVAGEFFASVVKGERDADVGKVCGRYGVQDW